jgi:beta-lactamase regulating signal transducer with metallopeptidase domain
MSLAALARSVQVQVLGSVLLHFLWQGALIAGVLWLLLGALPRARAQARYAACCAALAALLLAPLLTGAWLWHPPTESLGGSESGAASPSWFSLTLLLVWAVGSSLMLGRLAFGLVLLRRLVAQAESAPSEWQQALARLARQLGLRQRVRLLVSLRVDAPLVLGWWRPVVLVPLAALSSLPPVYLEALLAHELAHVRRFDFLVNVLQCCVEAVLFYHPAVHWVSRRMREEREHCCDDVAIAVSGDALSYARALTEMEALRAPIPELAPASNGGSLMLRIERILRRPDHRTQTKAYLSAGGLLVAAFGAALAGVWACSSGDSEASAPPAIAAARSALSIPWLPPVLERWQPALEASAHQHGVDPALLAIVTLVESLGDPEARSPGGALGLMQLMPSTAQSIANERHLSGYSKSQLLDPAYNLDLGAWYLARQLAASGSDSSSARAVEFAAVGYNGGPRILQSWLQGTAALPPETAQYRDLVVGMWNERGLPESPTYQAWRERLQQ